jgi:hypothetical protein
MRTAWLLLVGGVAAVVAIDAGAIGFGRVRSSATLGQALQLVVPVRLDEGESLPPECVSAEVLAGDVRIAPAQVQAQIDLAPPQSSELVLRVSTSVAIEEPIVTVTLSAGCPTRMMRRIVVFADPPGVALPQVGETEPLPPAAAPQASRSPLLAAAAPAEAASAAPPPRRVRRAQPAPMSASNPPSSAAVPAGRSAAAPRPQARLQLDAPDTSAVQLALASAEAQASAAQAAASAAQAAASAAADRLQGLEREMARLRSDTQGQHELMLQMRERLAAAEKGSRWVPWLLVLATVLLALAAWLGWRLRRLGPARDSWWDGAPAVTAVDGTPAMASTTGGLALDSVLPVVTTDHGRLSSSGVPLAEPLRVVAPPPVAAAPPEFVEPTAPAREPQRDLSVDDQIDLEQQADFFIVLGQEEAAIDLLLSNLRGTGGTSPMPYLKLLEIHRRRGERDAYERARIRFNQRFNGVAPAWEADPNAGRSLEGYPQVMARLQAAWWSPLDAMAELETLLFRRGDDAELFDLPAYQEVLALYQLARELHLREVPQQVGDVDVLLPLGEATGAGGLSVRHVDLPMETTRVLRPRVDLELEEPLDLDLSSAPTPYADEPAAPFIEFEPPSSEKKRG